MASVFISSPAEVVVIDSRTRSGTITLPGTNAIPNRTITFKDQYGTFSNSTLTLSTQIGERFEDGTTSKIFSNAYTYLNLYATSSIWMLLNATNTVSQTISSLTVNQLTFGTGAGWVQFGPVQASIVSSIQVNANDGYINNLYVGIQSTVNDIMFYGLLGNYNNTVLAEISTGAGTQELLVFKGSSTSDRVRIQTTGTFVVETGVSARLFNSNTTATLANATPAFIINTSSNVGIQTSNPGATLDVAGTGRFITLSSQQLFVSSINGGGVIDTTAVQSTVRGLGTSGYVSTLSLFSSISGALSSFSTVLGTTTGGGITTANLQSTVQGLGTSGYVSTLSLVSSINEALSSFSTALGPLTGGGGGGPISFLSSFWVSTGFATVSSLNLIDPFLQAQNFLTVSSGVLLLNGAAISGGGGGGAGVSQIVAGSNITISPVGGTGIVTVNATGNITTANVQSTVQGLGASGYVSTLSLFSSISGALSSFSTALGPVSGSGLTSAALSSFSTSIGTSFYSASTSVSSLAVSNFTGFQGTVSTLTASTITLGASLGWLQTGPIQTVALSTTQINSEIIYTNNLNLGGQSSFTDIMFYGLLGNYNNTVIAEQSTGAGTQELLFFKGSSTSDRVRIQTTGTFVVETGVSARLFNSNTTATLANATPAFIINTSSNVGIQTSNPGATLDVAGTGRFITLSTLQLFVSSINGGSPSGGGGGDITTANLLSTVEGLGTAGYVSTLSLVSSIDGALSSFSTALGEVGSGGAGGPIPFLSSFQVSTGFATVSSLNLIDPFLQAENYLTVSSGVLLLNGAGIVGGAGGAGVSQIIAGSNITITPPGGTGVVTINATGGGGGIANIPDNLSTFAIFTSSLLASTIQSITLSAEAILTSSLTTQALEASTVLLSTISTNEINFAGFGYLLMPDIYPNTVYTSTVLTSNILVGFSTVISPIQFYGFGSYSNTVIAELSTGSNTQELIMFRGSNATDRIRMQTTGNIVFESGVSARIWPTVASNATPAMIINTSSNVGIQTATPGAALDVAGQARAISISSQQGFMSSLTGITVSSLQLFTSSINGGIIFSLPNLQSTVSGLGTAGYISSSQLFSSIEGLGSEGYISSTQLASTVEGLGSSRYVSTLSLFSAINGSISSFSTSLGGAGGGGGPILFLSSFFASTGFTTVSSLNLIDPFLQLENYLTVSSGVLLLNGTGIVGGAGGAGVSQIVAGTAISISPPGGTGIVTINGTGVNQLIAGSNITLTPAGGTGIVTIDATGGGGGIATLPDNLSSLTFSTGFVFSPLQVGNVSSQSLIAFPGRDSLYNQTVIASQSTGEGTAELLFFQGSSISDDIRFQTTGDIIFEPQVAPTVYPFTPMLGTPTMRLQSNFMDVAGQGRFQTMSSLTSFTGSIYVGVVFI
jgi:hypothetical protein